MCEDKGDGHPRQICVRDDKVQAKLDQNDDFGPFTIGQCPGGPQFVTLCHDSASSSETGSEAQGDESGSTEPHEHCAKSGNVLIKLAEDEWALGACPGT